MQIEKNESMKDKINDEIDGDDQIVQIREINKQLKIIEYILMYS